MIALVCDTPYQIMSAVLAAQAVAPGEDIVFFINTYLYLKEQTFNYSVEHKNIRAILYYGKKHMGAGKLLSGVMNPQAMLKHIDGYDSDMRFDAIICSRTTYMATYLYNAEAKAGRKPPVYLIEEGIGEYTSNLVETRFTAALAKLRQKTHMDRVTCAYFSAPTLYPYKTPFPVEKIPAVTEQSRSIIESMFGLENLAEGVNRLAGYSCIFLSEPNSIEMKNEADAKLYDQAESDIMDTAADAAGGDMVIKVHPIDPNFKKEGLESFYSKLPMESLLLTMDCSSKFFVSSMSTAMLTPKLLFGFEPGLIFTYKILDPLISRFLTDEAVRQRYYAFIEGVMGLYEDHTRVAAPIDMAELKSTAQKFAARFSAMHN